VTGARLSAAALSTVYAVEGIQHTGPAYAGSFGSVSGSSLVVTVVFDASSVGSGLQFSSLAFDHCPTEAGVPADQCAWWSITGSDGKAYNATAALTADGRGVVLTAPLPPGTSGVTPARSSFGYGIWPVVTLYNKEGFPALAWSANVTAAA
jgi:hypothetical protein